MDATCKDCLIYCNCGKNASSQLNFLYPVGKVIFRLFCPRTRNDSLRKQCTRSPLVTLKCCCLPGISEKRTKFGIWSAISVKLGAWATVKSYACLLNFSALKTRVILSWTTWYPLESGFKGLIDYWKICTFYWRTFSRCPRFLMGKSFLLGEMLFYFEKHV